MRISFSFDSEEERVKLLKIIAYTLKDTNGNAQNKDAIENILLKHLEDTVKGAYIQGNLKRLEAENRTTLYAEAQELFNKE